MSTLCPMAAKSVIIATQGEDSTAMDDDARGDVAAIRPRTGNADSICCF